MHAVALVWTAYQLACQFAAASRAGRRREQGFTQTTDFAADGAGDYINQVANNFSQNRAATNATKSPVEDLESVLLARRDGASQLWSAL